MVQVVQVDTHFQPRYPEWGGMCNRSANFAAIEMAVGVGVAELMSVVGGVETGEKVDKVDIEEG